MMYSFLRHIPHISCDVGGEVNTPFNVARVQQILVPVFGKSNTTKLIPQNRSKLSESGIQQMHP